MTVTGFEMAEIDLVVGEAGGDTPDEADVIPQIDRSLPAVSRAGDCWQIGDHFLSCGDALEPTTYERLLNGKRAQLVFTDPPYNVRIAGNVSGLGKARHREFAMASGEMSEREFTNFLRRALTNLADFSIDGSIHFVCMDWRHIRELADAADDVYTELKNICVWSKNNAGMGSLYRSAHEFIFVYKHGRAKHINNVELGRFGRSRTNIWEYAGMSSFGRDRDPRSPATLPRSLWPLLAMRYSTVQKGAASFWTLSPVAAPPCSPLRRPADADMASNWMRILSTSSSSD